MLITSSLIAIRVISILEVDPVDSSLPKICFHVHNRLYRRELKVVTSKNCMKMIIIHATLKICVDIATDARACCFQYQRAGSETEESQYMSTHHQLNQEQIKQSIVQACLIRAATKTNLTSSQACREEAETSRDVASSANSRLKVTVHANRAARHDHKSYTSHQELILSTI